MRVKKTPKADLNNKRSMFTLIGLVLALGFTYICFEWSDSKVEKIDESLLVNKNDGETEVIDATTQDEEPPEPEVEEIENEVTEQLEQTLNVVENDVKTEGTIESSEGNMNDTIIPVAPQINNNDDEEEGDKIIYTKVDKKAQYPGGKAALNAYLKKNLSYPQIAIDNGIQGNVMVKFVVSNKGKVKDVIVSRSVDPVLDQEAIRVVSEMPDWIPAEQRNKPCNSYYTLPVNFRLKD